MTVEVTYADYQALGLKGGEALFDASLPFSRAAVDFLIGPNEVTDEDAYKRAVCLGVDAWSDASDGELRIGKILVYFQDLENNYAFPVRTLVLILANISAMIMGPTRN